MNLPVHGSHNGPFFNRNSSNFSSRFLIYGPKCVKTCLKKLWDVRLLIVNKIIEYIVHI